MLRDKLNQIFYQVQQNASCHQKYCQLLLKIQKENSLEEFEVQLMRCIEIMFGIDALHKDPYADRLIDFTGTFIASIHNESEQQENVDNDDLRVDLFRHLVKNILQYHNLESMSARYRSCQLVNAIFSNLADDVMIDSDIWDSLQEPLLERLCDEKPMIRVWAARSLARLQVPSDPNCKVILAFLEKLYDPNVQVRREIVRLIAPNKLTVNKIAERVRDSDHYVRLGAYRKCRKMGPKVLPINVRQSTLSNGFHEPHPAVKNYFLDELLTGWLSSYDNDYLVFLDALTLDSSEDDVKHSNMICKSVLEVFFKNQQLQTIIDTLPIDENKIIPIEKLTYQSALYWYSLVDYLRNLENTDEYLEYVIPELLPFCAYIKNVMRANCAAEGWKFLESQHKVVQLLKIVTKYDLSDEAGRKALHQLVFDSLRREKLGEEMVVEFISIVALLYPTVELLTNEICGLICDIRQLPIAVLPSEGELRKREFQLAQLDVERNILEEDLKSAVSNRDFVKADELNKKLLECQENHKKCSELYNENVEQPVTQPFRNDSDILIRCLDILIGMLISPKLSFLTASLRTCKEEFVLPLSHNTDSEVCIRVFRCLALYCTLDKDVAKQNLKLICSPIYFYQHAPHENFRALLISIATVCDVFRLFGRDILGVENEDADVDDTASVVSSRTVNGTRRLYTDDSGEEEESHISQSRQITIDDITKLLLSMLDDDREELRNQSARCLCELLMSKVTTSVRIMTRLVLKWLISSPDDSKLQQSLGNTFLYLSRTKGGEEIFERTVIPVLSLIGNAPRTSPLADIDSNDAVRFLAAITCMENQSEFLNTHKNLAYSLCCKILQKPHDKCVPMFVKMLLHLEPVFKNLANVRELISQTELIVQELTDKACKKNVEKFSSKLKELGLNLNEEEISESVMERVTSDTQPVTEEGIYEETRANNSKMLMTETRKGVVSEQRSRSLNAVSNDSCNSSVVSRRSLRNNLVGKKRNSFNATSGQNDIRKDSSIHNRRKSKRLTSSTERFSPDACTLDKDDQNITPTKNKDTQIERSRRIKRKRKI